MTKFCDTYWRQILIFMVLTKQYMWKKFDRFEWISQILDCIKYQITTKHSFQHGPTKCTPVPHIFFNATRPATARSVQSVQLFYNDVTEGHAQQSNHRGVEIVSHFSFIAGNFILRWQFSKFSSAVRFYRIVFPR